MDGVISIDPDVLRRHAARVDATADAMQEAVAAARSLNLGGGAFGLMCGFMVPPIALVSAASTAVLDVAQGWVEHSAELVRSAVADFEAYEDGLEDQLRQAAGRLP